MTAERTSHAYVVVAAGRLSAFTAAVTRSPHHVEQAEDDDPEQVDHVPVGGAGSRPSTARRLRGSRSSRDDDSQDTRPRRRGTGARRSACNRT